MVTWSRRPCRPRRARADRSRHRRRARRARRGRRGRRARHGRRGRWSRGRERASTGSCDFTYRRSAALGGAHGAPAEPRRHIWWIHWPHDSTWSRTDSPTMNSRFMQTVLTEDVCDTDTGLGEVLVVNTRGFLCACGGLFLCAWGGARGPIGPHAQRKPPASFAVRVKPPGVRGRRRDLLLLLPAYGSLWVRVVAGNPDRDLVQIAHKWLELRRLPQILLVLVRHTIN